MESVTNTETKEIYLPDVIGGGYRDFWYFKGRYRVVKGSRASKKSKTTALWYIVHMMQYNSANLLVVRKTGRTLLNSCFAELCWAVERLGVSRLWKMTKNPLEMTYLPTGQKILFMGLDDPLKITSVTVPQGNLCWLWIEEAFEVLNETDFNKLDGSIRGKLPKGLFHQITLTLNPWSDKHWIKKRFFDSESQHVLAKTTNYMCNEFLGESDQIFFEEAKKNPKRYRVEGLGEWGIIEGVVYENWKEQVFNYDEIRRIPGIIARFGMDFGYSTDPTALFCGLVDNKEMKIYVFDELYEKQLTNTMIFDRIKEMGYIKEKIRADSAEPKSIEELYQLGMYGVTRTRKGRDSIKNGIQKIQDYEIIVHPKCVNFIREISTYSWARDRFGEYTGRPEDANNHLMDAMRYGLENITLGDRFSF